MNAALSFLGKMLERMPAAAQTARRGQAGAFALLLGGMMLGALPRAEAQYFNFGQLAFSPDRVNPAALYRDNAAVLRFVHRNAPLVAGETVGTSYASAAYPMFYGSRERRGAVGINALSDRAGRLFRNDEIGAVYAHAVRLASDQYLNLGVGATYARKRLELSGALTESVVITGQGIDPLLLQNGQAIGNFRGSTLSLSAGLFWQRVREDDGRELAHFGVSGFGLNRPNASLAEGSSALPFTWQASGGLRIGFGTKAYLAPEAVATVSGSLFQASLGTALGYEVSEQARVELHARTVPGRVWQAGVQFHTRSFSAGFLLALPQGSRQEVFQQAQEFGVVLRKEIAPRGNGKGRDWSARKSKPAPKPATPKPAAPKPAPKVEEEVQGENTALEAPAAESSSLPQKESAAVPAETLPAYKVGDILSTVRFAFNSDALTEEGQEALRQAVAYLGQHPGLRVEVVGHADSVGPEEANRKVALERAKQVADFLRGLGVEPLRIGIGSKGEQEPVAPNADEAGRALNRRVVVLVAE
jgi:type IX secretion system PorP/SprF family membrane protein